MEQLPEGEVAVWSVPEHELLGASPGAWRWLGWLVPVDGAMQRLPAETYGDLPPLSGWAPTGIGPSPDRVVAGGGCFEAEGGRRA
jgi:hypothetical protein